MKRSLPSPEALQELCDLRWSEKRKHLRKQLETKLSWIQQRATPKDARPENYTNPATPLEIIKETAVWGKILGYLEDPLDVMSAYYTCKLFRDELANRRKTLLLPEVLKVLRNKKYLRGNDCLNMRLASKFLREKTDDIFMTNVKYETFWNLSWKENFSESVDAIIKASSELDIRTFPIRKAVTVDENSCENAPTLIKFLEEVTRLIESCGKIIFKFTYEPWENFPLWEIYVRLSGWVACMPNLKNLEVSLSAAIVESEFDAAFAEEIMNYTPFPHIPSLEVYYGGPFLPQSFNCAVVKSDDQLKQVKLLFFNQDQDAMVIVRKDFHQLEKIEGLDLLAFRDGASLTSALELPIFSEWPLKRIHIRAVDVFGGFHLKSSLLFGVLNEFKMTLEEVELVLFDTNFVDDGGSLELSNLKRLTWSITKDFDRLDFMLPLKSIDHLVLRYGDSEALGLNVPDPSELIKLKGFLHRMHESNIWKLFPHLRVVALVDEMNGVVTCASSESSTGAKPILQAVGAS